MGVLVEPAERGEAGVAVRLDIDAEPAPPSLSLSAYRIIQEALTNTIRHADAARAAVTLCYEPGYVTVSITDSGRRPDRASPAAANGTGTGAESGTGTGTGTSARASAASATATATRASWSIAGELAAGVQASTSVLGAASVTGTRISSG